MVYFLILSNKLKVPVNTTLSCRTPAMYCRTVASCMCLPITRGKLTEAVRMVFIQAGCQTAVFSTRRGRSGPSFDSGLGPSIGLGNGGVGLAAA